jgi:3-oxoacyl-[acyl-carrier-protein] synthase II
MADPRVVITGLGMVTPLGIGIDETWEGIVQGKKGVCGITVFDPGEFKCTIAGELDNFSARKFVPKSYRKAVKVMARDIEIAVAAADLAFLDADIETKGTGETQSIAPERLACNIGAGLICTELDELGAAINTAVTDGKFDYKKWGKEGIPNLTPLWLLKYLPNMLSCHVTIIHDARGPSNCITCGDASGLLAAAESSSYIQRGSADVVITGAAESKLNQMGLLRQELLGRLCNTRNNSPADALRPFDKDHDGMVIGEGGGLMIFESLERATTRGGKIYAEPVGFGAACDPNGINVEKPTAGNLALAVKSAMRSAGITPDQVSMIAAYGTGVPGEDIAEVTEWRKALGDVADKIPAFSTTGATGSLFAGGGGAQLSLASKALSEQIVPPTVNFTTPDEGCEMNLSSSSREGDFEYVVAGAFTVGGQSGACVLKRYQG